MDEKPVDEQRKDILRVIRALRADDFSARVHVGNTSNEDADILRELDLLAEKLQSKRELDEHANQGQQRKLDLLESTLSALGNDDPQP
jgi:hypothetical protein